MKLRPMRDRVVIKQASTKTETKGGIIIPLDHQKAPTLGKVISCGISDSNEVLQEGDTVLFTKYAGTPVKLENEDFIIMKYSEILAVIEK